MHRKFGQPSPGKMSSHSAVLPSFFFFTCAVFSCFHTTGCELGLLFFILQMDMGSLTCAQMWVRAIHTKTNKSAQVLTQRGQKNCSSPCSSWGSNPGSSDLNSYSLTTEPHPQSPRFKFHWRLIKTHKRLKMNAFYHRLDRTMCEFSAYVAFNKAANGKADIKH